ncbi:hypothetical protein I3842_01G069000 [Carya illinoinensis]|uniref:BED-type domain-containing protein n=1 Tax=Carya illinoinensis TaxID=32201 RepID=A0A922FXJ7_CARIL|nr:hypothetical protein I3842_01G069000 [Carya illinoinensis]
MDSSSSPIDLDSNEQIINLEEIQTPRPPSTPNSSSCPLPKKRKENDLSIVWNHFTKVEDSPVDDAKAKCNYCGKMYACHSKRNETSTMQNHLPLCPKNPHKRESSDKYQKTLTSEATPEEEVGESDSSMVRNLITHKYSEEAVRSAIVEMVIIDELPFRIVEGQGFKKMVRLLEPQFKVPCRVTVVRDGMKLFASEKTKLKKLLKNGGMRISLTIDSWTSIQNLNYMCLTTHFLDSDWKLQKKIINFCLIPNHRGDTIGRYVESCLRDWDINKIFTVTVDNASSNDTAILYLRHFLTGNVLGGKYMHIRCCAHIMNLVVNEGLKECNDAITMVRNAVKYVRSSPAILDKFKECAKKEKIDCEQKVFP